MLSPATPLSETSKSQKPCISSRDRGEVPYNAGIHFNGLAFGHLVEDRHLHVAHRLLIRR
jgi:hypothetical protein